MRPTRTHSMLLFSFTFFNVPFCLCVRISSTYRTCAFPPLPCDTLRVWVSACVLFSFPFALPACVCVCDRTGPRRPEGKEDGRRGEAGRVEVGDGNVSILPCMCVRMYPPAVAGPGRKKERRRAIKNTRGKRWGRGGARVKHESWVQGKEAHTACMYACVHVRARGR